MDLPAAFGLRLNRQLLNPAELNTKDAQFSYSINLPATRANNAALDFAGIEEVGDKFNRVYRAEYIARGVRIFSGLFRLSEVTPGGFRGNLYKPVPRSVRDVFADIPLNGHAAWRIPFDDFAASVSGYNLAAETSTPAAIFPAVLYGVLPKVPQDRQGLIYSPRDVWDATVYLRMNDLPPSVNVLQLLRHVFDSAGYTLQGTAFDDTRLARLYMSYKNADDYVQPWNYGHQARMSLSGSWSSDTNRRDLTTQWERGVYRSRDPLGFEVFSVDLLDATNSRVDITQDVGGNILYREVSDADAVPWARTQVRIPTSGFYKVRLRASINVNNQENERHTDPATGVSHISGRSSHSLNDMASSQFEVKLLRDRGQGDFGLTGAKIDGRYYYDNQPQNTIFDDENIPKYFPPMGDGGPINFIDLAQNRNLLLGLHVGEGWRGSTPLTGLSRDFVNPLTGFYNAAVLAAKPAQSWNASEDTERTLLAIQSPGWTKYGLIGDFDDPDENPDTDIPYDTATRVTGQTLDEDGNPQPGGDPTNVILHRFPLERYYTYRLTAGAPYAGTAYIHLNGDTDPILRVQFVDGAAEFSTGFYPIETLTSIDLTLYLVHDGFDIDGPLVIARTIDDDSEAVIGWEATNRYAINVNNAPATYARRGTFDGASADPQWNAETDASAVIWLEAGELLTVASASSEGRYRRSGQHATYGMIRHRIDWELSVQPFRVDKEWLQVDLAGNGTGAMDWDDPVNFDVNSIDLIGFMSADVKTNDFVENFIKAFNLRLSQIDGSTFALDVKQQRRNVSALSIDIDGAASVRDRTNAPLGLPERYRIGYTVDTDEQGFAETGDTGGGEFLTGVPDGATVEQISTFSMNWFKDIAKIEGGASIPLRLPVVSKADVWAASMPYPDAMDKRQTDLAYRFWYADGQLGASFEFNGQPLTLARLSDRMGGVSVLTYHNAEHTILDNYFTLLINGASHYTEVELYLTAEQYARLNGHTLVRFNGDLYYCAEVSGYDPTGRNKTKLKLIKRI